MPTEDLYSYLYKFKPEIFSIETFREVARKKGWRTQIAGPLITPVEREILTYDTFAILAEFSKSVISFGGGTLLNWVYARDNPRFSFDLDSQIRQSGLTKEYVLENVVKPINEELRRLNKVQRVPYGNSEFEIGTIVLDAEKDHFPDVLSLKRRVYSITAGSEAHRYLRKESKLKDPDYGTKVKEFFGGKMPRIEDVRIEIGIPQTRKVIFPVREVQVWPLVHPEIEVEPVTASLTEKEYNMALKVLKLGRHFEVEAESYALADFVKAACDLHACAQNCDERALGHYLKDISKANGFDCVKVIDSAGKRLRRLANNSTAVEWFEKSGQTSFIAQSHSLAEFVEGALRLLRRLP